MWDPPGARPYYRHRPRVTATDLDLAGAHGWPHGSGELPGEAVLRRVCWDGPPEFPNVHGHFATQEDGHWVVDLHTAALKTVSRWLNTRQRWGI